MTGPADLHEARFRALFTATEPGVRAYVRRRSSPPIDIDDVVSDVYLVAWRRLADVPEVAALPWLYGVARRVLANERRSARRQDRLLDRLRSRAPVPRFDDDAGTAEAARAEARSALQALRALRPLDQEVLRLAAWESLAPAGIAVVLGCTPNAAAIRLHRARRRYAAALAERTGGGRTLEQVEGGDQ